MDSSSYTHRKLLFSLNTTSNPTVQTCLYYCNSTQKDTVPSSSSSVKGFCPTVCLSICPSTCKYSLSSILPPDNSSPQPNNPHHNLSPLLITMLIVLATAFLLISFYVLYTKLCYKIYHSDNNSSNQTRNSRRRRVRGVDFMDEEHEPTVVFHPFWYIPTVGLNPTVIGSIAVHKYVKGMDEKECAVCLAEFVEGDDLKILPKCSHAFHIGCIDTWLKSHVNCPLCRAPIVPPSDQKQDCDHQGQTTVEDSSTTVVVTAEEGPPRVEGCDSCENDDLEGGLGNKEQEAQNEMREENNEGSSCSSQRWSLERGASNLVSRSLSCSAKIFSSRYNNKPSPNS